MRSKWLRPLVPLAVLALFALPGAAQGSDNCATPTVIAGTGTFNYNNSSATTGTQGQSESLCFQFGTDNIDRDVWFTWTAPSSGGLTLSLCGGPFQDMKVAAYPGSACPANGTSLACDDDYCGSGGPSELNFNVVAGQSYVFQIGTFPGTGGISGSFTLGIGLPFPPPVACGFPGPDVIVGHLIDTFNMNAAGGFDATAIGTYSCNIGQAELNWFANNNNHPVIGQNLYRYKVVGGAGRFEQVGMNWLKHGFTALQDLLCCSTCTNSGTGSRLGVGCADPYDAGLNASQTNLGPHWQVNAFTGVFTYPPANPGFVLNSTDRRLKVATADLEVTGGVNTTRYFGEGHYIAKDDAAAGNGDNNAAWREVTVAGGPTNFTFALLGVTHRIESAIEAWDLAESGVTTVTTHFPSEGKLILAAKATDLGGGQWHYEYAVYNMNSDRSVGSVAIPIPAGVNVTNIGFHDVAYHSGDGIGNVNHDGTDWPSNLAGGFLTWATTPFGTNQNANAIRWGTTYNFRFDADVAPATGDVTLGQFKVAGTHVVNGLPVPGPVPPAFEAFCSGTPLDPTHTTQCPCANSGVLGNGCAHSFSSFGANLAASGSAPADNVLLTASNTPGTAFALFMQHDAVGDTTFHDGVLCAAGNLVRLRGRNASGGVAYFPDSNFAVDQTITLSQRGGVTVGSGARRYYAAFYRNASTTFCPPATANVTNGWVIDW